MGELANALLPWVESHGRRDLPWQRDASPYRVWVSEIMLQQTQVKTVIPYFIRFTGAFPQVGALARAPADRVLHLWTGLGYYARARNLHRAAQIIVADCAGRIPADLEALRALPGIGRSTAGAILALGFGQAAPILDGNAKRVLARYYGVSGWPGHKPVENRLWELAERETPRGAPAAYTQAVMDLGATVCVRSRPLCDACPLATACVAFEQGSQVQLPGKKPRKALPTRRAIFAIIENERGEMLLEKRPPAGIWGGLWSLPECQSKEELLARLKTRYSLAPLAPEKLIPLPTIRHVFSHFYLDIEPVKVAVRNLATGARDEEDRLWHNPESNSGLEIGMPAPVKALLGRRVDLSRQSDYPATERHWSKPEIERRSPSAAAPPPPEQT